MTDERALGEPRRYPERIRALLAENEALRQQRDEATLAALCTIWRLLEPLTP